MSAKWLADIEAELAEANWVRPDPEFQAKSCPAVLSWTQIDRLLAVARAAEAVCNMAKKGGAIGVQLYRLRTALEDQADE